MIGASGAKTRAHRYEVGGAQQSERAAGAARLESSPQYRPSVQGSRGHHRPIVVQWSVGWSPCADRGRIRSFQTME